MDDDGGAIGMIVCGVGVNVGVEEVREIGCTWYFLETKDVGLIVHVMEYCKKIGRILPMEVATAKCELAAGIH